MHVGNIRWAAESMRDLALQGAVILPPVPGFHSRPKTIEDLIDHTVGKILDRLGVHHELFRRWNGPIPADEGRGMSEA